MYYVSIYITKYHDVNSIFIEVGVLYEYNAIIGRGRGVVDTYITKYVSYHVNLISIEVGVSYEYI